MRRPISTLNPVFYYLVVRVRRFQKHLKMLKYRGKLAKTLECEELPYRVYKHQSVLIRKLGEVDLTLQYNKVHNLKIAINTMNGIIIRPGEIFSFCHLVGNTTKRKGYKVGMQLSNGEAIEGIGGGVCQIANLIHWLSLHSELTVLERHHHSFDPFPDSGRVVPFGCGATIFYNYSDYQLRNDTEHTFQFRFWFDDKCINGDLRSNHNFDTKFSVFAKNEKFTKVDENYYRENEIWREERLKKGGEVVKEELIQKNYSLVKYTPENCVEA